MYKIIILMGEAGSGKDSMMQEILRITPNLHEIISCTSRPMREKEKHGVNYFYYSVEDFQKKIENGDMLEHTIFNNWYYGTGLESVKPAPAVNIGVFNPAGVRSLLARPDCEVDVYWVRASAKKRLLRQLNREEDPDVKEIIRRAAADFEDFDNIDFDFKIIRNESVLDLLAGAEIISEKVKGLAEQGQN